MMAKPTLADYIKFVEENDYPCTGMSPTAIGSSLQPMFFCSSREMALHYASYMAPEHRKNFEYLISNREDCDFPFIAIFDHGNRNCSFMYGNGMDILYRSVQWLVDNHIDSQTAGKHCFCYFVEPNKTLDLALMI